MQGLTSEQVKERINNGQVNSSDIRTSRSYSDIIIKNAVTPFNIILIIIGIALLILDNPISAISATGIITVNILVSTIQEMRAKHRLDKISLLTRPKVTVIRDGTEQVIDQKEIVKDDLIVIRAGEQALVDGNLIQTTSLEMDESLLTGESSTVRKNSGDIIYSGSFCITGEGYFNVTAFGDDSYASQMLTSAKKFTSKKTPLQMETNTITTVLMVIAFVFLFFTVIFELLRGISLFDLTGVSEVLELFVICLDIVPIALFLLITLTYMLTAIRMSKTGVLLQRFNSVESLSHVDVVCMDKTGTITTNNLLFESAVNLVEDSEAEKMIRLFINATGSKNKTIKALIDHYGKQDVELLEEIQFSSSRKYSAVRVAEGGTNHRLYSGAWTVLKEHVSSAETVEGINHTESSKGFRTLIICEAEDGPLLDGDDYIIPALTPISIISIRDEVRSDCRSTMDVFMENGMEIKVLSGDDPVTVDALFKIADIPGERRIITGPELESVPDDRLDEVVMNTNIFGRMKPENKERVIEVLKRNHKYVAMIGDGVNDVKPIKSAQVGIALESGSGAARGVADMILMSDNFSALPKALVEGRRTISGIRDILKIYISRNFTLAMLYLMIFFILGRMPMIPIQNTFYAFVAVTVIAFFMTVFSVPDKNDELILPNVLRFCIPSAIIFGIFGMISYLAAWHLTGSGVITIDYGYLKTLEDMMEISIPDAVEDYLMADHSYEWDDPYTYSDIAARTSMVLTVAIAGALQLLIVCPYFRFLSVDGNLNKRKLPLILLVLIFGLVTIMYTVVPWFGAIVGMVMFSWEGFALAIGLSVAAFLSLLLVLKRNLLKGIVASFERWYLKKLDKEYAKGDVVNVESREKI